RVKGKTGGEVLSPITGALKGWIPRTRWVLVVSSYAFTSSLPWLFGIRTWQAVPKTFLDFTELQVCSASPIESPSDFRSARRPAHGAGSLAMVRSYPQLENCRQVMVTCSRDHL